MFMLRPQTRDRCGIGRFTAQEKCRNTCQATAAKNDPSQISPVASTRGAGAPKGESKATRAASRMPIPPCVSGRTAASLASGHAKNQIRSGRSRPQEIARSAVRTRNVVWMSGGKNPAEREDIEDVRDCP